MHFLEVAFPFQKIDKVIKSAPKTRQFQMDFLTSYPPGTCKTFDGDFRNINQNEIPDRVLWPQFLNI